MSFVVLVLQTTFSWSIKK